MQKNPRLDLNGTSEQGISTQQAVFEALQQVHALEKIDKETKAILNEISALLPSPESRITREFYILHYRLLKTAGFTDAAKTFELSCPEWSKMTGVSDVTIRRRLREYYKVQRLSLTTYPVSILEASCADLLGDLPVAGEDDILTIKNRKYTTITRWAFGNSFTPAAIQSRVTTAKLTSVRGKTTLGRVREYFLESEVNKACVDLIKTDQADEKGFFARNGIKYGMPESWADELGINKSTTSKKLKGMPSIEGRDRSGRLTQFYAECDVRSIFDEYLSLPRVEDDGFKILGKGKAGKRYATAKTWSEEYEIDLGLLRRKLVNVACIDGISRDGPQAKLYPEDQIKEIQRSLPSDLERANNEGIVNLRGVTHRTIHGWAAEMGLDEGVLKRKLCDVPHIQAMTTNGHIANYYSEKTVKDHLDRTEWKKRIRGWPELVRSCQNRQDFLRLFRKAKIPSDKWSDYTWLQYNGFSGLVGAVRYDPRFDGWSVFMAYMEGRLPMGGFTSEQEAQDLLRKEILRLRASGEWIEPASKKEITQEEHDKIAHRHYYKRNAVVRAVADFLKQNAQHGK